MTVPSGMYRTCRTGRSLNVVIFTMEPSVKKRRLGQRPKAPPLPCENKTAGRASTPGRLSSTVQCVAKEASRNQSIAASTNARRPRIQASHLERSCPPCGSTSSYRNTVPNGVSRSISARSAGSLTPASEQLDQPDHLLVAIAHGWFDDKQIDVAVVVGISAGVGTEKNDPARVCRRHQPLYGRVETIGCRSPRGWCVCHTGILPPAASGSHAWRAAAAWRSKARHRRGQCRHEVDGELHPRHHPLADDSHEGHHHTLDRRSWHGPPTRPRVTGLSGARVPAQTSHATPPRGRLFRDPHPTGWVERFAPVGGR